MVKRYLLLVIVLLFGKIAFAQVPAWGGNADLQDYSFGFTFQYVNSYFKIDKRPDWRKPYFDPGVNRNITDSVNSISSPGAPGFAVGFLARYSLTDFLEIRTTPSLVFADRTLNYTYATPSQNQSKAVQSTSLDLPVSFKLKSERIQDFRAYMLAGIKYSTAIGSKKNNPDIDPLDAIVRNKSGFGSYEIGLGCDIYFEYFKLSPEIKISNSFGNVLISEDNPFATPINKLSLHTVTFSLIFE
ncbi:type IX secretion/gliding motility protein PorT/SprT [Mucilaginibacter ginsenosidivorans]|uniref:PorT family protein n=1 Tax=Mucilaginibacter ginsenosidivorans TaxID=398053 RepID=A0A5B8V0Z1_9SPHI|nr:outer membrane beta-barrel protein [Mucilaginibacter ginsenosidivorans]QEC65034.1 PorT family protein [Mucilaginibacter ginsenosidivorans]